MSIERRRYRRYPVSAERSGALLQVGSAHIPARTNDVSASGFSVSTNQNVAIGVGQDLLLQTTEGWHQVLVVHARHQDNEICLGLHRIRDFPTATQHKTNSSDIRVKRYATWYSRSNTSLVIGAMSTGLSLAVFTFVLYLLFQNHNADDTAVQESHRPHRTAKSTKRQVGPSLKQKREQRIVENLLGASTMTWPGLVQTLSLSREQAEKVFAISAIAIAESSTQEKRDSGPIAGSPRNKLIERDELLKRVFEELSDTQRSQLERILSSQHR